MEGRRTIEDVVDDIDSEGFDYALIYFDDYSDVRDEKFQELYKQYKESRNALSNYLGIE